MWAEDKHAPTTDEDASCMEANEITPNQRDEMTVMTNDNPKTNIRFLKPEAQAQLLPLFANWGCWG